MGTEQESRRLTDTLALDPGACTGWALFRRGELIACGHVRPDDLIDLRKSPSAHVVIENPQIYPRSKARPRDLLTLARIVGRYQERYKGQQVHLVSPHEWKGSIKKEVMTARIEKNLTPLERKVLESGPFTHDTIDAIGLGKWWLGL